MSITTVSGDAFWTVPFADLHSVNGPLLDDFRQAFERVLSSGAFISGATNGQDPAVAVGDLRGIKG